MTDLQILSSLNVLARNNTKPEISDEKRNMECVLSKWEPPVQNRRFETYAFNKANWNVTDLIRFIVMENYSFITISFITFWDFLMFYQIFLSPQVKRCAIITHKHGIYDLPQEFPNNIRLRILGNYEISGNCLNFIEWLPSFQFPCQNGRFVNTRRKLLKNRN